jgi:excisionase family DNA binding protein
VSRIGCVHLVVNPTEAYRMDERQTYTIEEAARIIGIGRNSAFEAAKRGEIPVIRVGRRILVPRVALDRLLEARGKAEAPTAA